MHKHFELYDCGLQPECGGRERRGRQKQGSNELSANLIKNALCGVADGPLYVCASLFRNAFKMRFSVSKLPRPRTGSCIAVWKCVQNVFFVQITKNIDRACTFVYLCSQCTLWLQAADGPLYVQVLPSGNVFEVHFIAAKDSKLPKPRPGPSTFVYRCPEMLAECASWLGAGWLAADNSYAAKVRSFAPVREFWIRIASRIGVQMNRNAAKVRSFAPVREFFI